MKNKREQAMALLDALEQVDDTLLQQACDTETAQQFRTLGAAKRIKASRDRPVTVLQRWGVVAVCLVVILALAASPWFFSTLLPTFINPTEPTEPTIPPTTATAPKPTAPRLGPPELYITNGTESIRASQSCGNWSENGGYITYFDGFSATDLLKLNRMPWLTTDVFAILEFETPPDSIEIQCWDAEQEITTRGKAVSVTNGMLHLEKGSYVYEISAFWGSHNINHGKVTYLFAVNASFESIDFAFTGDRGEYLWPSMVYDKVQADTLNATTEDGTFVCLTEYIGQANLFVACQLELLQLLQGSGMDTDALTYYAVNYGDSFSRSDYSEAYIDWSAVRTWQQVLVTLQAMWGDYTDYGYVYAMANAIAAELNWQTDEESHIEEAALADFFSKNQEAVQLLYPSFNGLYANAETIISCQALSRSLFAKIDMGTALDTPIENQLIDWHALIRDYAQQNGIFYEPHDIGYAYCSARIPLKIRVINAEFYIDDNYVDGNKLFLDAFVNYASIYETASILYQEILNSKPYWNPDVSGDTVPIYFISEKTAAERFGEKFTIRYVAPQYGEVVYTRYLSLYMYGYYKHIVYQWNQDLGQAWQSQAFCELGRSQSWFSQRVAEVTFTTNAEKVELFYACTGRTYELGREDFFEMMDISCFVNEEYTPRYTPVDAAASIGWYLLQCYGEENIQQLLLFPDTVQSITGKTWAELEAEWAQYIKDKYADVVIPDSIANG